MPSHNIDFRVVEPGDRSTRNIMIPIFAGAEENRERLTALLGEQTAARIIDLMNAEHIDGAYKEFNLLPGSDADHGFDWVLLMGLGKRASIRTDYRLHDRLRSVVAVAARFFRRKHLLRFALPEFSDLGVSRDIAGRLIAEGATLGVYRFENYKSESNRKYPDGRNIQAIHVLNQGDAAVLRQALHQGGIAAVSTCTARDLVNTPALDLTPSAFADHASQLAKQTPGLEFEVLRKVHMEVERMSLHLAVARGSDNDPCVAILTYAPRGKRAGWDLGLVGKGVTFDAGGYNIKPTGGIERMYGDMGGAAAVLGAMRTIATLKLPINVVAVMPLAENLINGSAYKPGDVLLSRKGLTVEVTNTDAEGRLLLADAIDYTCERFKPHYLLNIATLTGAIRIALGNFVTGLFTHSPDPDLDDTFAERMIAAGRDTGEWLWRLPVDDDYLVQLSSTRADIQNCSTDRATGGGAITAAVFLRQFVDFNVVKAWAHLDIAATSMMLRTLIYNKNPYQPKEGATGVGVRLFSRLAELIAAEFGGN